MLIYLLIISGAILTIIGTIFMEPLAKMLGAEGEMLLNCVIYGRTILIALTAFLLQNCFQSFLVVAEKPGMGLKISIIVGIANMVLDFLFIYVLKMQVFGAALATGISQAIGGVVPLVYFLHKNDTPLRLIKTKFELKPIIKACTNGSSEMLTNISMSLVNILYNMQLMKFAGSNGVVAYGIIMYVGFIFVGTYVGYSVGSAPIISYHYGANNKEELKNLFRKSLKLLTITSIVMTCLAEILARPLASIFVNYDKNLLEMTTNAIRLFSISYVICSFNIFSSAFFTALNNGLISAIISFLRTLVFQIAAILILPTIWGLNGIWIAIVFAEILSLIVAGAFLIKYRKKYEYA